MLALTLDQAKTIAVALVVVLVLGAIASAWLMKTVVQKLLGILVLGLLAFAVWSQRDSLQRCADLVKENVTSGALADTECEFFQMQVTIPGRDAAG